MIEYPVDCGYLVIDEFQFEVGDLVTTILGDYGIIIKIGKHSMHNIDKTDYCHVLIGGYIRCYMPFALIKIKKNLGAKNEKENIC